MFRISAGRVSNGVLAINDGSAAYLSLSSAAKPLPTLTLVPVKRQLESTLHVKRTFMFDPDAGQCLPLGIYSKGRKAHGINIDILDDILSLLPFFILEDGGAIG